MKKRGKVPMELSPSSSCFPDDEYMPRTRLKHQNLLQDYEDSIKVRPFLIFLFLLFFI